MTPPDPDAPKPAPLRRRVRAVDSFPPIEEAVLPNMGRKEGWPGPQEVPSGENPRTFSRRFTSGPEEFWTDWVKVPEPELRRGLLLCLRAHCWMAGIEEGGAFCRDQFAEFDAVLEADGIEAARQWTLRRVGDLMDQRRDAGLPVILVGRGNFREFWRKLHHGKRCWPPTSRDFFILSYGVVAQPSSRKLNTARRGLRDRGR